MSNNLFCLIKFGRKTHMENLLKQGQVHFALIEDFNKSIEKERGDAFEGAFQIINEEFTEIKCYHPELGQYIFRPVPDSLGQIVNFDTRPYCSYSILAVTQTSFLKDDNFMLDSRLTDFGDHAVIIKEPVEFINRVRQNLVSKGIEFACKPIKYKRYSQRGEVNTGFFNKDISYAINQNIDS